MSTFRYFTVSDALKHLQDSFGSNLKQSQVRMRRLAILAAYQHLTTAQRWRYYIKHDRISVAAPQSTGTLTYVHSTRTVTLSGATFPAWADRATLVIGTGEYEIESATTGGTTAILSETSNPGADLSSAQNYTLYNDRFLLPLDLLGIDQLHGSLDRQELDWTDPNDFLSHRKQDEVTEYPKYYTMLGDTDAMGRLMLRVTPFPAAALSLDYSYFRKARPLLFDRYKAGTITTAGTTAVAGTSTSFTADMEGSVLRVSYATAEVDEDDSDSDPQAFAAMVLRNPFIYESRIETVTDATNLVTQDAIAALSGVRYEISDQIDVEPGAMFTAFLRCCEWQLSCLMRADDADALEQRYTRTLQMAIDINERYNLHVPIDPPPVADLERRQERPLQMGGR